MWILGELESKRDNWKRLKDLLLVKEFREYWESDKGKEKDIANKGLLWVAQVTDFGSRYNRLSKEVRERTVTRDVFGKDKIEECLKESVIKLLRAMQKKYDEMQEDQEWRSLQAVNFTIDEMNKFMMTSTDELDKIKQKADLNKRIKEMLLVRDDLINRINAKNNDLDTRGGVSLSPLEENIL